MHIRRIRLRKEYHLKVWLFIFTVSAFSFIFIPEMNRSAFLSFFRKDCRNYQHVISQKLNDRIPDYIDNARLKGIEKCTDEADIAKRISSGQLFRVRNSRYYTADIIKFSYKSFPNYTAFGMRFSPVSLTSFSTDINSCLCS